MKGTVKKTTVLWVLVLSTVLLAPAAVAELAPAVVGEHVSASLETPHPYPSNAAGGPSWVDEIFFPDATYISVHFARMDLAPGDHVIVRSPDGNQSYAYTGFGRHNLGATPDGFFATHIKGDTAIIELFTRGSAELSDHTHYGYSIDQYGRGYSDVEIETYWALGLGEEMNLVPPRDLGESLCTADDTEEAKCYELSEPDAYEEARAAVRLLLNGSAWCTGWLLGSEGHVMTNEHCVTSQAQLNNIDFEFMAEGATCGTNCGSSLACPGTIEASGGTFVTDDVGLDYALLLPDTSTMAGTNLNAAYGYMQLRETGAVLDERIYIVQHPAGWGKRFAMLSTYPGDPTGFANVSSVTAPTCTGGGLEVGYWADTQGGSSGSAVLGYSDNLVVALHHCRGSAFCASGNPLSDDRNRGVPIQSVIADLGALLPMDALGASDNIFDDSFETGDTTAWDILVP